MLKQVLSLVVITLLSLNAKAETHEPDFLSTCELAGVIRLQKNTQIFCDSNLRLKTETEIITQGFELMIYVQGTADFSHGLNIRSYDAPTATERFTRQNASAISVIATTSIGRLDIDNQPLTPSALAGDVHLEYVSTMEYDHRISQAFGGGVEFILNGNKEDLLGPLYKPRL